MYRRYITRIFLRSDEETIEPKRQRQRGNEVWIYRIEAWSALMAGARKTLVGTVGHVGGQWLGHKYPGVRFRASR